MLALNCNCLLIMQFTDTCNIMKCECYRSAWLFVLLFYSHHSSSHHITLNVFDLFVDVNYFILNLAKYVTIPFVIIYIYIYSFLHLF